VADYESFPYCSYQYVLYGMGFRTDLEAARSRYSASSAPARQAFAQLRGIAQQACAGLPTHRALIDQIYRNGFLTKPDAETASTAGRCFAPAR
jgi:tryptophan halogenase